MKSWVIRRREASRILIIDPIGNLWGSEKSLVDMARALSNEGIAVRVICPPGPLARQLQANHIPVDNYFPRGLHERSRACRGLVALRLLISAIRFRPDVIHANQAGAVLYGVTIHRLIGTPASTHVRVESDVEYLASLGSRLKHLGAVICVSKHIRDLCQRQTELGHARISYVYDLVGTRASTGRVASSGSGPRTRFICVTRIEPNKRVDLLIEAFGLVSAAVGDATLTIVGDAPRGSTLPETLARRIHALGLDELVHWTGYVQDIEPLLAGADILVCPFEREALGRVIVEAWDADVLPVAWSGSGGPAELIEQARAGLLYPEQTATSLATALVQACRLSTTDRDAHARNARLWISNHCDPHRHVQALRRMWRTQDGPR